MRFSRDPTVENYATLVGSTKLILAAPVHGGKQRQHTTERLLRARLSKWHAGDIGTLWSDVKAAWDKSSGKRRVRAVRDLSCELPQDLPPAASRRVCQLAAVGALSKACKVLCSRGVASDTPETRDKLIRLFPTLAQPVTITTSQRGTYDSAEIRSVVERMPSSLAPGPSGLRSDYFKAVLKLPDKPVVEHFLHSLCEFVNVAVSGSLPAAIQPYLCGGKVIPCNKKDRGIRPIVLGDLLRNLVSTCVLRDSGDMLRSGLHGDQFGVRSAGLGMQAAVFKAQHMAKSMNGKVILKIDLKNAFNTINRSRCASAWATCDHDSAAWVSWCLSQPSNVLFNSQVLSCTNGVQQGEPLSPLFFALGINDVISSLGSLPGLTRGKQSLISLSAVHVTTWTTGCNPWISMSSEEFRFSLRWILGVQVSRNACWCTFCGARQDQFGRAITHYHNVLRDPVQAILIAA